MHQIDVSKTPEPGASTALRKTANRTITRLLLIAAALGALLLGLQFLARTFDMPFIDNTIRAEWAVAVHVDRSPTEIAGAEPTAFITRDDVPVDDVLGVADPFLLPMADRLVLLAEVIVRDPSGRFGERGFIGAFESVDDGASWQWLGSAIEAAHHLSYPFPVRVDDDWFVIPESGESGETVLYRATDFPTRWVRDEVLLEGNWGDPTIIEREGTWFLFAVDTTGGVYGEDLHLFTSASLRGPWAEHPDSPIVRSDASKARPAGALFEDGDGRLWRPAQQNQNSYGEQLRAFEILELTPSRYREAQDGPTLASATGEGWNASGMHHVSVAGEGAAVTVVDGFRLIQDRTFGF